jgi:Leucine-rich repeat (LRR) protein
MKRIGLILMAFLLGALPLYSQIVPIPDTAFRYALIREGVDTDGDSLISSDEAEQITYLKIAGNWEEGILGGIKSIKGIEAFINLDTLRCHYNQLSSLDLSNNTSLTFLHCNENQLSSLDVSACNALRRLVCERNLLTKLDVSNNTFLEKVICSKNQLSTLDISHHTALMRIGLRDNPNLQEVCVWTMSFPPEDMTISTEGSPNVYFTIDCNSGR